MRATTLQSPRRFGAGTVAMLAGVIVALAAAGTAWGAPTNGKIAFDRFDPLLGGPRPFTVDPNGTHEIALPGGAHDTSLFCHGWAPDGSRIAVCADNAFGLLRAATMNPDGTGYTLLDPDPALELNAACSIWSPDAARLLCVADTEAGPVTNGLYTQRSSDGGDLRRLTTAPADHGDEPVGYSPDGSRILFLRNDPNGNINGDLYTIRPDGTGMIQLNPPDLRVTSSGFDGAFDLDDCCGPNAAWSPDGARVVFSGLWKPATNDNNKGYQVALYVVNADGTGLRRITALGSGARDGLAWSPRGDLIAYSTRRQVQYPQLYVVRPDGTGERQLTQPTNRDVSVGPVFSPDGAKLVFSSYHPEINGGQEDLWTINVDGTGLERLTSPLDGFAPGENNPVWGTAPVDGP